MPRIYPDSLTVWQNTYVGTAPSDLWTMQGAGPGISNEIGSDDLVLGGGTVLFQQAGEDGRFAIEFVDAGSYLQVADTSFGDVGPNPISVWARCMIPSTAAWASNATFMGKRATSGSLNRWYVPGRGILDAVETLRSSFGLLVQDATHGSQSTERCMHQILFPGERWIDMIVRIDLANNRYGCTIAFNDIILHTERAVDDTSTVDNFGGGNFALGAHSSGGAQPDSRMSYCAKWTNHYLTDTEILELVQGGQRGPIITNVIPADATDLDSNLAAARFTPVQFDVIDDTSPVFSAINLKYEGDLNTLVVHDGVNFRGDFVSPASSRTAISGGFRYVILPLGGWRASIEELSAPAVSPLGKVIDF